MTEADIDDSIKRKRIRLKMHQLITVNANIFTTCVESDFYQYVLGFEIQPAINQHGDWIKFGVQWKYIFSARGDNQKRDRNRSNSYTTFPLSRSDPYHAL